MYTAIETFCGAGGMGLGLEAAGYDVRSAFDIDGPAVKTYNASVSPVAFIADAAKVSGEELLKRAGLNRGELTLLSGGPPCQGFSKQKRGAHLLSDPRNGLVVEFARLVRETEPGAFLFENVEIFGQKRGQELISELEQLLADYAFFKFYVCCSDFGLAQTRGRFLIIGMRSSQRFEVPYLKQEPKRQTIRDVIADLPPPPDDCSEHPLYANHLKCRISKDNEERIKHVPPGGGWQNIPWHLRLPCHQKVNTAQGGWPDVYGRLTWEGMCPTITGGFDSFSRGRYGHPEQHRAITPREAARLQGFPDKHRFMGTRGDVRAQIGNAVPPPVAQKAGEAVIRALEGLKASGPHIQMPEGNYYPQLALAI